MNPMRADAQQLISEFKKLLQDSPVEAEKCHLGIAPVTLALTQTKAALSEAVRPVYTVAQDLSRIAGLGAYTGEVSAELLKDSQIDYVLVGHSERRELFADTPSILNEKVKNALQAGLTVIYCVGEKSGNNVKVVRQSKLFCNKFVILLPWLTLSNGNRL